MFGIFRFFLATLVVISHLTSGYQPFFYYGFYAVFGFYCLSGYLMTMVLRDVYGFTLRGSKNFWINRALRIFPSYYVVAILTFLVISLFPNDAAHHHPAYAVSLSLMDVAGNVLLFPFEFYRAQFRLVPPSWSVGVELLAYFLLWLFISRGRKRALVTLIAAIGYVIYTFAAGLIWNDRYFPIYAALLPFSIGSLMYQYHPVIKSFFSNWPRWLLWVSMLTLLAHLVIATRIPNYPLKLGFYVNLVFMIIVIAQLSLLEKSDSLIGRMDVLLGNLSYPLFLSHTFIGFFVSLFFRPPLNYGLPLLMLGFPASAVFSLFISKYIDEPINKLRDRRRSLS